MKKFAFLLCAALVIAATSCGGNSGNSENNLKPVTPADSLAYFMGMGMAQKMKQEIKQTPDSAKYNSEEVIKGAKDAFEKQKSISFSSGILSGFQLEDLVANTKNQLNVDLDRNLLLNTFNQTIKAEKDLISNAEYESNINSLINRLQKDKQKSAADSLAYYMAVGIGQGIKSQILNSPSANDLNKNEIIEGAKLVFDNADNLSYRIGLSAGQQISVTAKQASAQMGMEFKADIMFNSFIETIASDDKGLSLEECNNKIIDILERFQASKNAKEAPENEAAGEEFLKSEMEADKNIKVTESGLAYKILEEGKGAKFTENDTAHVIYTGTFTDGTTFDSSNGKAVEFGLQNVIPGIKEAMSLMSPGAHYIIYVPGKLAYGMNGVPEAGIGANQMLVFDFKIVTEAEAKKINTDKK